MKNTLHFICPTDYLEPIISNKFRGKNYYFTSLGNSVSFNNKVICHIKHLINEKNVNNINFVLSDGNNVVLDAMEDQDYSNIRGLDIFYKEIITKREQSEKLWKTLDPDFLLLSYHLNSQISELSIKLNGSKVSPVNITGKIYKRRERTFSDIYSNLIDISRCSLN